MFLDEIHTIIGAGGAEGAIDASNILKPSLARGEIQLIGATTREEYRKYIEKDAALERRFQPVVVEEPTEEQSIAILKGLRPKYEEHHKVTITDDALVAAVRLSARYINDRFLPDKAIDLIDEASSKIRLTTYVEPAEIKSLTEDIDKLELSRRNRLLKMRHMRKPVTSRSASRRSGKDRKASRKMAEGKNIQEADRRRRRDWRMWFRLDQNPGEKAGRGGIRASAQAGVHSA